MTFNQTLLIIIDHKITFISNHAVFLNCLGIYCTIQKVSRLFNFHFFQLRFHIKQFIFVLERSILFSSDTKVGFYRLFSCCIESVDLKDILFVIFTRFQFSSNRFVKRVKRFLMAQHILLVLICVIVRHKRLAQTWCKNRLRGELVIEHPGESQI
uniref:Uncharacterized protein n=1 Tax=Cacopsylla melanoneura TaxID=428564 RepID=A0A8D8Z3X2_9HEMI